MAFRTKSFLIFTLIALVIADFSQRVVAQAVPPFTDNNWIGMGGTAGAVVNDAVVDSSGNLYIGGDFTIVGDVPAAHIAKWNGSGWSPVGSGFDGAVIALAVAGSD